MSPDAHFPIPLRGEFLNHGRRLRLTDPFVFRDGKDVYGAPAGFVSDFNSVPRLLWVWFPPWEHPEAAVIHDFLYQYPNRLTREQCDQVHRRILQISGMRASKRHAIYLGIRAGGWLPWNRYRKDEQ